MELKTTKGMIDILRIEELHAGYGEVEVLHGIDLKVSENEIVALIGGNSSGKTTFLSCVSAIEGYRSGKIMYMNEEIQNSSPDKIVDMGLIHVPEGRLLFPRLTVRENLEMGAFCKRSRPHKNSSLEFVFEFLPKLKERENQISGSLSGGEAQMLAIGRGLMAKPRLLMLDEPSLGLAPIVVLEIMKLIKKIRDAEDVTILLVEQNVRQSLKTSDRTYVLENGGIVISGESKALLNSEEIRKAYLGM